jgi:hypothetical protein
MKAIETTAFFDENGKLSIDNLPLVKNQKAKIIFLFEEESEDEFYAFSAQGLAKAYSDDEPEYDTALIKEINPEYKK